MTDSKVNHAIGWLGEFKDSEIESRFRNASIDNNRRMNIAVALAMLIAIISLALNDPAEFTSNLLSIRGLVVGVSILCGWISWSSHRWPVVYAASNMLVITMIVATLIIDLSRPPDYLLHLGLDVILLLAIYIAIPGVKVQLFIGAGFSAALLWMHITHKTPLYAFADVTVPVAIFLANFLGVLMSALYNRVKRQFFAQITVERDMRLALEKAKTNIDELSRLLPMCANCKKIRDDEGYWQQVEIYMHTVSGQKITHSICPDCVGEFFEDEENTPDLK